MKRFLIYVAVAVLAAAPAIVLRLTGWRPSPVLDAGVFGLAVLGSGFMLSWGAEAAESRVSQGLLLAGLALVTVLPEYAIDIYYAFRAGQAPQSAYVHYAAANMTGANRLLVGFAWPMVVALNWWRTRNRAVDLLQSNTTELFFLLLASAYAFVILFKDRIDAFDFVVLLAIFGAYIWRVSRAPKTGSDDDDDVEEPGPAAVLGTLTPRAQWAWTGALTLVAGAVILLSAEPFAESMISAGRVLGIDEFLLIQWVAPLTGESPEILLAVLFVLAARPGSGLIALISDKINQWTLLVGALPMAMSVGGGRAHRLAAERAPARGVLPDGRAVAVRHFAFAQAPPRPRRGRSAGVPLCGAGRPGIRLPARSCARDQRVDDAGVALPVARSGRVRRRAARPRARPSVQAVMSALQRQARPGRDTEDRPA